NNTNNLDEESCHGVLNNVLPIPLEESTLNENLTAAITNENLTAAITNEKSQQDTEQTLD
ncbi:unnamed protein product, partial [Rotaria magnacalcarata]